MRSFFFSRLRRQTAFQFALLAAIVSCAACGDNSDEQRSAVAAPVVVQRSVEVAGSTAPPNPEGNLQTPPELNRAAAQTYQTSEVADAQVAKVLVLVPGFLGGAGNFDYLARRVVVRSAGKTVVWAVDRRSNALEDQTGLDAAEAGKDAEIAKNYYFRGATVNGRSFAGFVSGDTVRFVSEWGIRTHVEDLDALISAVRQRYPQAAIFLGGHSLGASIVPIYAAWDFGGRAGFERLSGIVLLEGAPAPQPASKIPAQAPYETVGIGNGFGRSSVHSLRSGDPLVSLRPFVTTDLFVTAQIIGMHTSSLFGTPLALSHDKDLFTDFFALLFGMTTIPDVTNRAALGFGFDNDFEPLSFARVSVGQGVGTIGPNPNAPFLSGFIGPGETLLAPLDPVGPYDWRPASESPPAERDPTDLDTFATVLFRGPTDFIEWYFPARLTLDVAVTAGLNVQPSGDWRKDVYGLNVTENARVDVPVFAVGGSKGLLPDLTRLNPYRDSIAPTLRNGTARGATAGGFQTLLKQRYVHLDVLTAADEGAGNGLFGPLVEWMDTAVSLAPPR